MKEYLPKIADYLVLASDLKINAPPAEYHRANALALELAMVLPAELFRSMSRALTKPSATSNRLTVAIEVRRLILGEDAGDLTAEELISHAPGAGSKPQKP